MAEPPRRLLKEKDFIHESKQKSFLPFWVWGLVIVVLAALLWSVGAQLTTVREKKVSVSPFLQVTNRQMSIFLWQNPEYMRVHRRGLEGYLPGFPASGKVTPLVDKADANVAAPPEILFLYHTWNRLLGDYVMPRKIAPNDFLLFLDYAEEWRPANWPAAPKEYKDLVEGVDLLKVENMQTLSNAQFPPEVRNAFIGWQNYFNEGDKINALKPTVGKMQEFLEHYPHYARNYWQNLYPNYLQSMSQLANDPSAEIPSKDVDPFLRVAFYNFRVSQEP